MKNKLQAMATGIGSLPHTDVESALNLIFQYVPNAPFWPQLPKRNMREGMISQFSENLPCLKMTADGIAFNPKNKDRELEIFYEKVIVNDTDYFKISQDFSLGLYKFHQRLEKMNLNEVSFIKCQTTGPFTMASSINDDKGIALVHDEVFMQVILKGLIMKAAWQINLFKRFGKKIILFFDEPFLGCFGSAYTSINREDVVKGLTELTIGVKSEDVLVGVHCCGNTDWSIFTDIPSIDIISFDAFGYLERLILYAHNLKTFFKRGGLLCWGIVPTQEFTGKETPDLLLAKLKDGLEALIKKGLDKELLLENLLLSPSCGLAVLDPVKAEKILRLLSDLPAQFKNLQS